MPENLITADNVTKELLKSIFESAMMDVSIDSYGDIMVKEDCKCFVLPDKEKRRITLLTFFVFKPKVKDTEKLLCVNQINRDYIMARAVVTGKDNNILQFTYDIMLDGEISYKYLVLLVKRFCAIPHPAVADYGQNIVE